MGCTAGGHLRVNPKLRINSIGRLPYAPGHSQAAAQGTFFHGHTSLMDNLRAGIGSLASKHPIESDNLKMARDTRHKFHRARVAFETTVSRAVG
jgi:hypothetical protein